MVKSLNSEPKPGEIVTLSTGKDRLVGTVAEIYGPPDRRWATVDIIVTGSSGEPLTTTSTAVPADRLRHVELKRDASWRACAGSLLVGSEPIPVVLLDTVWREAGLGDTADCRSAIAHRAAAFAALDRSDLAPERAPRSRDGLQHIVVRLRHLHEAMQAGPYAERLDERY